jgi:hypothetical protein
VILLAVWGEEKRRGNDVSAGNSAAGCLRRPLEPPGLLFLGLPRLDGVRLCQLLQGTSALSAGFARLASSSPSLIAAFSYQYTSRIEGVLGHVPKDELSADEVRGLAEGAKLTHARSGTVAVWSMLGAAFCFSTAQAIGLNPENWRDIDSLFAAFISVDVWLSLLLFLSFAAAITGTGILYVHYHPGVKSEGGADDAARVQKTGVRLSTVSLLCAPAVLLLTLVRLPDAALSGWVYVLTGLAVLFLFGALHALYAYVRLHRTASAAYAFGAILLATTALVSKDQVALHNVTKDHAVVLAEAYDRSEESLKSLLGRRKAALR